MIRTTSLAALALLVPLAGCEKAKKREEPPAAARGASALPAAIDARPAAPAPAADAAPARRTGRPSSDKEVVSLVVEAIIGRTPELLKDLFPSRDQVLRACPQMVSEPRAVADLDQDLADAPENVRREITACADALDWRAAAVTGVHLLDEAPPACAGLADSASMQMDYAAGGKTVQLTVKAVKVEGAWMLADEPRCEPK